MGRQRTLDYDKVKELTLEGWGRRKIATFLETTPAHIGYAQKAQGLQGQAASTKADASFDREEAQRLYDEGAGLISLSNHYGVSVAAIRKHVTTDPSRQYQPTGLNRRQRRLSKQEFNAKTKRDRFAEEKGHCQECGKPIGDGTNYRLATYHHIQLLSKGGTAEPSNCMVLHHECHYDPVIFRRLHGFSITYR